MEEDSEMATYNTGRGEKDVLARIGVGMPSSRREIEEDILEELCHMAQRRPCLGIGEISEVLKISEKETRFVTPECLVYPKRVLQNKKECCILSEIYPFGKARFICTDGPVSMVSVMKSAIRRRSCINKR